MSVTLEKALAKLAENLQEILKVSEKKKSPIFSSIICQETKSNAGESHLLYS